MEKTAVVYTVHDLIRALGGTAKAARFFATTTAAVSNWERRSNRFPPDRYFEHQGLLRKAGIDAHPSIWFTDLRGKTITRTADGWRL